MQSFVSLKKEIPTLAAAADVVDCVEYNKQPISAESCLVEASRHLD